MNIIQVLERYPTQQACINHLESIRFGDSPYCPHCNSNHVARKNDGNRVGRWNCHECHRSFNVLAGTIFQGTRVPLRKWFAAIAIMLNAKKSVSSPQLARDLDLTQPTAWYMQQRIRRAMLAEQDQLILQGIIEADETYIGGKPRKPNNRDDDTPGGQGVTDKTPVIGAVERGGKVVAQVAGDLKGNSILAFIRNTLDMRRSFLITDESTAYNAIRGLLPSVTINHSKQYVDGEVHTNTIENVWGLLKRAWYGSHHHYSIGWMPLYVAETCWKYNHRDSHNPFAAFMCGCFS